MSDSLFLLTVGSLVILAQQIYGWLGWACPGLVDKT